MPIRIVHQLPLTISQDVATPQKNILFARDADLTKQTIDGYTKQSSGNFDVPDAGDETYTPTDIDSPAKGLYLEVSADCSVYLSGSTDPIELRIPPTPQTGAMAKLFLEGNITSLRIVADQGAAVAGAFCFWGAGTT